MAGRRFVLSGSFFTVLHTKSAVKRNAIFVGNFNNADSLVVNLNLLFSVPTALVRSMDHDFVDQIVQDFSR